MDGKSEACKLANEIFWHAFIVPVALAVMLTSLGFCLDLSPWIPPLMGWAGPLVWALWGVDLARRWTGRSR